MKSVVIGQGFIGTHLIERLKDLGHAVTVYHHKEPLDFNSADYVFYLASYGNHYSQNDRFQTIQANLLDLLSALEHTKDMDYKGFIHFSTSSVTLPVQTLYSETKAIAEYFVRKKNHKNGKPTVSIRPASIYGPGEAEHRFIPTVIHNIKKNKPIKLTDGMHDWTYIEDFIDGVIAVINNIDQVKGRAVGIGTGIQTPNRGIINKLFRIAGKEVPINKSTSVARVYDTTNWTVDATLVRSFGWEPKHTTEEGLQKTYESTGKTSN